MSDFWPETASSLPPPVSLNHRPRFGIQPAARLGNPEHDYNRKRCRRKEILAYKKSEFESAGARKRPFLKHRRMAATTTGFVFKLKQTSDRQRFLVLCAFPPQIHVAGSGDSNR
jgi:hypothetical protein